MAKLLNREFTREQLLRYTSNLNQLAGITKTEVTEGRGKGTEMLQVKTGSGLSFNVLQDKCLDIFQVNYKGVNMGFMSKNGLTANTLFDPHEDEFLYYCSGGFLFTCGTRNAGPSSRDTDGSYHPFHGRIGNVAAENVHTDCKWVNDEYTIEIGGRMRETALFGPNMCLERSIRTSLGSNEIEITDTLSNDSPEEQEFVMLYHFNFGFPFLDECLKVMMPKGTTKPRTEIAATGIDRFTQMTAPQDGFFEHVFFHDFETDAEGNCTVRLENPVLGIGAYLKYEKKNLPITVQWKSMRSGDYALGIEPCNSYIKGRKEERDAGTLFSMEPFGKRVMRFKFGVYDL